MDEDLQEVVQHVAGHHSLDPRLAGSCVHHQAPAERETECGGLFNAEVVEHRTDRRRPVGAHGQAVVLQGPALAGALEGDHSATTLRHRCQSGEELLDIGVESAEDHPGAPGPVVRALPKGALRVWIHQLVGGKCPGPKGHRLGGQCEGAMHGGDELLTHRGLARISGGHEELRAPGEEGRLHLPTLITHTLGQGQVHRCPVAQIGGGGGRRPEVLQCLRVVMQPAVGLIVKGVVPTEGVEADCGGVEVEGVGHVHGIPSS